MMPPTDTDRERALDEAVREIMHKGCWRCQYPNCIMGPISPGCWARYSEQITQLLDERDAALAEARRGALDECEQEAGLLADTAQNVQDQQRLRQPSASVDRIVAWHGGRVTAARELQARIRALAAPDQGGAPNVTQTEKGLI